ncbi:MAG: hypothetical protein Q8L78_08115 [Coxiellaceae bacterium]|nr:hypothetical protein [Coxiellaceae bacterium]
MPFEHNPTEAFLNELSYRPHYAQPQALLETAALLTLRIIQSTLYREQTTQTKSLKIVAESAALNQTEKKDLEDAVDLFEAAASNNDSLRTALSGSSDSDDETWMSGEVFDETLRANAAAKEVLQSSLTEKLADDEKKSADSVIHHASTFPERAIQATYIGALLLAGTALTIFTHGFFSTQGGALIAEATDQLDILINDHPLQQHEEQFHSKNKALAALLKTHNQQNNDVINIAWTEQIKNHCKTQKKTLDKIATCLNKKTVHHDYFISEINTLYQYYEKQEEILKKITVFNTPEATQQLRDIAFRIEAVEKKAIPLIEHVKNALPLQAESHCTTFIHHAKNFYYANKNLCKIVGLASLTALGIGLTIATGGIGGLLGAAALCVVANAGIKAIFQRAKKAVTEYVTNSMLDKHADNLKIYCETQKNSLDQISASISPTKNPLTRKEMDELSETYTNNIQALEALKNSDEHDLFKLKKLMVLSLSLEKLDKKAQGEIKKADGLLSEDAKKESAGFIARAEITHKENKKTMHAVKKTTIAIAAITVLSIAVKGTSLVIAVATAAISALFSFTREKVSDFTKNCLLKTEKDSKGKGEEKTDVNATGAAPPH